MYIAIDLILAVILASVIIGAWRRGFVRSVFKLCSTLAAIVIAVLFYKELSDYFYTAFVLEKSQEYVGGFLQNFAAELPGAEPAWIAALLPEQLQSTAGLLGLDLEEILRADDLFSAEALGESLSLSIATVISNIIAFAVLFFGSLILLGLIGFVLNKVAQLPILNGANKFLGLLFGIAEALVLGVVLSGVAEALLSAYGALNADFAFTDIAENTYIAAFLLQFFPW